MANEKRNSVHKTADMWYCFLMNPMIRVIHKEVGQTPLEALENFRSKNPQYKNEPITYAGRLDPMASGKLIILISEECKNKEKYLNLDKEYEVEILFGISTDSYDILGIPKIGNIRPIRSDEINWNKYTGKFDQDYPPYSSKTFKGKQLHSLARAHELPDELPKKNVEIYDIKVLNYYTINSKVLLNEYVSKINSVNGDFRQKEILDAWYDLLSESDQLFSIIKIKVSCSSGTYMRSLADRVGKDLGTGAITLSINRTEIKNTYGAVFNRV